MRPSSATAASPGAGSPPHPPSMAPPMPLPLPMSMSMSLSPSTPSFSVLAADYAIPRAILAPHIQPVAPAHRQHLTRPPSLARPQYRPHAQPHNASVLHPVFFTENLQQQRQSFGRAAIQAPPHAAAAPLPITTPAPPLPHATNPVAHGYVYRENTGWLMPRTRPVVVGTGSKL